MNLVKFKMTDGNICGFTLSGHCTADAEDEEGKLVCSAVSSAAYLVCNTITDVIDAKTDLYVDESYIELTVIDKIADCQNILMGFRLHITELAKQYNNYIKVNSEV